MEKEMLIKFAEELHQEAFAANAYSLVMQQYEKNWKVYKKEMYLSPAFYGVVYEALQKACFMEIAKLYDNSCDVISIGSLINDCQENTSFFSQYQDKITIENDGESHFFSISYQSNLETEEKCFLTSQIMIRQALLKILGVPETNSTPITIELTLLDLLNLYHKLFCSLSKKQERVRMQRNKIYAHNDAQRIQDLDFIVKKCLVTYPDIQELIDFALDFTSLVLEMLTGSYPAKAYSNIDDLENTLELVNLGLKYQDYDMKQKEKAIMRKMMQQLRGDDGDNLQ